MNIFCYHGTNQENAQSILKQGFRPETWFAYKLENAIVFGGNHVFEVEFDLDEFNNIDDDPDPWQFFLTEWVKPDKIVDYKIYLVQ